MVVPFHRRKGCWPKPNRRNAIVATTIRSTVRKSNSRTMGLEVENPTITRTTQLVVAVVAATMSDPCQLPIINHAIIVVTILWDYIFNLHHRSSFLSSRHRRNPSAATVRIIATLRSNSIETTFTLLLLTVSNVMTPNYNSNGTRTAISTMLEGTIVMLICLLSQAHRAGTKLPLLPLPPQLLFAYHPSIH